MQTALDFLIDEYQFDAPLFRLSPDTLRSRMPILRNLARHISGPANLTPDAAREWLRRMRLEPARGRGERRRNSTVNQYRKAGKNFGDWLVWRGYLSSNPFTETRMLPEEDKMQAVPSSSDLLAVLEVIRGNHAWSEERRLRDYLLVLLVSDTGMRISEILGSKSLPGLAMEDVVDGFGDTPRNEITFWGKGRQGRARLRGVAINPAVREAMCRYLAARRPRPDVDALFVAMNGERWTPVGARRDLARACEAAEVPLISPHRLRAYALSSWHDQDIDFMDYKALSGHTDDRTVHRYAAASLARRAIRTHRRLSPVAAMVGSTG